MGALARGVQSPQRRSAELTPLRPFAFVAAFQRAARRAAHLRHLVQPSLCSQRLERVFQSCFRALQSTSIEIPCFPERSILSRFILPPSAAVNAIFAENGHSKGDTSHTSAPLLCRQSTRIRAELNPSGCIAAALASAHFFRTRAARS